MSYSETVAKIKALREQAKNEAKLAFHEESKRIFVEHSKLESFSWRQYTPYFNDGDECVFSAHIDEINFHFDGKEYEYVYRGLKPNDEYSAEFCEAANSSFALISAFEEEDLKELFGDHVEVVVTKDGPSANEYTHD